MSFWKFFHRLEQLSGGIVSAMTEADFHGINNSHYTRRYEKYNMERQAQKDDGER